MPLGNPGEFDTWAGTYDRSVRGRLLAGRFLARGCRVWGIDFSGGMLELAARKCPGVSLARADLLGGWPVAIPRRPHASLIAPARTPGVVDGRCRRR